jgi:hypothetical protein
MNRKPDGAPLQRLFALRLVMKRTLCSDFRPPLLHEQFTSWTQSILEWTTPWHNSSKFLSSKTIRFSSALQARVLHVGNPIVFELLLRHFAVTIRVKGDEYSGRIIPRHWHPQVFQKFYELTNVDEPRSAQVRVSVTVTVAVTVTQQELPIENEAHNSRSENFDNA